MNEPRIPHYPKPPEPMRWFLLGCILTALGVGVFLFSPWFAPLRPALYEPEPPNFADYFPTATPTVVGTPTPPYAERMSSWLAVLSEAEYKYRKVRPTIHSNADGSQDTYTTAGAMWGTVCWWFEDAEKEGAHNGTLPSTRRYIARACDNLTEASDVLYRGFIEGREADYERGLFLTEQGFENVRNARMAYLEGH